MLLFIVVLATLAISHVSATDAMDNDNLTVETDSFDTNISNIEAVEDCEDEPLGLPDIQIPDSPDAPDLVVNETFYVHQSDIDEYFTDGVLDEKYANKILVFSGNFENTGKLVIDVDNVTVIGSNSYLKNTVFDIGGDGVTLSNLNIDLDSRYDNNDYAGIIVTSDNVVLSNLNINYVVPSNTEAYAIYAVGNPKNSSKNLRILNSNIYFEGHNDDVNVYDNAVKIMYYKDSLMDNNTVITSFPLKNVNHGPLGATLDSEFVLTVGFEHCDNFIFKNNALVSDVNKRPGSTYPTLDCMMVSRSDNCQILNNSIYMTDFITLPGVENYLYGLDVYSLNNLTVANNNIRIVTTGGKLGLGTAYPIQITGPISKVNITLNDLYTYSNGPNIGIYSQNYYGDTELSITNNRINVTGLAGTHEWALVAGIESQDSDSYIANNIIEVHSVGAVGEDDNIYGISYRQSTAGSHRYDIQDNVVFSDGFSSVYLLSSDNSTVANNLLVSYNEKAENGNNGFRYGDLSRHNGISFYNNRVIRAFDYFASLNNEIDGESEYDYSAPVNNGISNNINGRTINGRSSPISRNLNPLIPGSAKNGNYQQMDAQSTTSPQTNEDNDDGKSSNNPEGEGQSGSSNQWTIRDAISHLMSSNGQHSDLDSDNNYEYHYGVVSNNSDSSPSDAGDNALGSQSSSAPVPASGAGESKSVSKSYELEEKLENNEFIPSIFYVVAAIILLIVGIKRKKQILD
jgi:hypothetical protein